ncbi:MAG: cytochrome c biogenesis CcdA family protein [Lachnospiraceae bacterium]
MQYFIAFLEGIITFISPCLLPMLPIYISYFAGKDHKNTKKTLIGAIGFVLGFTVIFIALGALAGTFGSFLTAHQKAVNLICGLIVIFLGLNFLGIFKLELFKGSKLSYKMDNQNFLTLFIFGMVFSIGWTPCVGAFLGSALMMASTEGKIISGMLMLLFYSLGLGIPFILSALLIQKLKAAFDFIKKNYRIINLISGGFLILVGIFMATGTFGRLLSLLSVG